MKSLLGVLARIDHLITEEQLELKGGKGKGKQGGGGAAACM